MEKEAEVVVVGAGIVGLTTAYNLAKAGKSVIVLEKGDITRGSSAANTAFVWLVYRPPGPLLELGKAALQAYEEIDKIHNIEFERQGSLTIYRDQSWLERQKPFVDARNKAGLSNLRLINRNEVLDLEPNLASFWAAGMYNPDDAHINPFHALFAFAGEAKKFGARIYTSTEVTGINVRNKRVDSVMTNKGEIKAKYVVNACGAYASSLGKMVSLKIPISFQRDQLLVTEEMPSIIHRTIMEGGYKEGVQHGDTTKATAHFVASPMKKGNLLLGGVTDFPGDDIRTTFETIGTISRGAVRAVPVMATLGIRVIRSFAKFFIFTPDALPILGKVEDLDGFIMAGGLNDYGIGIGPGVGKAISELICFGESSIPLDQYRLSRFSIC